MDALSQWSVEQSVYQTVAFFDKLDFCLTDQEISSAVKWEAEQYIPIPIQEAIIQHQIIERRENVSPPEVVVLLVAAPRTLVEKYIQVVEAAKLNVVAVETELISLVRSLAPTNQTTLILDFGARSTDLAIAKNGFLVFSRSIPSAGEAFTRAVSQTLGINPQQAEEYKKVYGIKGENFGGKIGQATEPILLSMLSEIKKAQAKALLRKGWFDKRLFLYWSSDDSYKSNEKRHTK